MGFYCFFFFFYSLRSFGQLLRDYTFTVIYTWYTGVDLFLVHPGKTNSQSTDWHLPLTNHYNSFIHWFKWFTSSLCSYSCLPLLLLLTLQYNVHMLNVHTVTLSLAKQLTKKKNASLPEICARSYRGRFILGEERVFDFSEGCMAWHNAQETAWICVRGSTNTKKYLYKTSILSTRESKGAQHIK